MLTYELVPKYESRKSYYGKAVVIFDNDKIFLESYATLIAVYDEKHGVKVVCEEKHLTQTTLRHLKEWMQQLGYDYLTKKQIVAKYM